MSAEMTGRWEELVSRPEFRGHQVRITRPADDSREGIDERTG